MKIIASIFKTLFVIYIVSLVLVSTKAFAQCPNGTYLDIIINPDQYPEETSWAVLDENLDTVVSGGPYIDIVDYSPQVTQLCVPNGDYTFEIYDLYGDGVAGSLWGGQDGSYYIVQCNDTIVEIDDADFGFSTFDGFTIDDCAPPPPIFGCMDSSFVEFLPIATVDTGMCLTPKVFGCTDSLAYNYLDTANTDILVDSCTHTLELTDLAGNGWAGSYLQVFQGNNFLGIFTLDDGFDTTFTFELSISEPIGIKFNITQQSDFTAVQCGYSLYSGEHVAMYEPGGFANPLVPFQTNFGLPYCGNSCIDRVYGCTDVSALNYNALANTDDSTCYYLAGCTNPIYLEYNSNADFDDGSCATLVVLGCMDSTAYNYDPAANVELVGSCVPFVYGCMDPVMFNYDPLATASDTCIPYLYGCTDASMFNYDINANTDNGSCIPFVYGCTDTTMYNYDPLANTDNGTCVPFVYGCTETIALNFDALANTNDGSCIYPYLGCTDSTAINYEPAANVDDGSCIPFIYGCTDPTAFNFDATANTEDGSCIEVIYGCMDPTMFNYNPDANTSNGSCISFYYGCMDSTALNYDDDANTDNGSCIYAIYGCNDPTAINYDPLVNTPDSSCEYSAGCAVGDVYTLPNLCFAWVIDVDEYCCDVSWDSGCVSLYEYCQDGWTGPTDLFELRDDLVTYPNPTSDYIYVNKKVDLTVINMLGDIVVSEKDVNSLDVSKLPSGIYNVFIEYNKLKINKKIIKQ